MRKTDRERGWGGGGGGRRDEGGEGRRGGGEGTRTRKHLIKIVV